SRLPMTSFFFQAEAGIRAGHVTGVQTCALPISARMPTPWVVTLHAHTLDGVLADIHKVGETLELKDEADELVAGLRYRLRRVARSEERRVGKECGCGGWSGRCRRYEERSLRVAR